MAYLALPTNTFRIPYHIDGSLFMAKNDGSQTSSFVSGPNGAWFNSTQMAEANDGDHSTIISYGANGGSSTAAFWFLANPWRITHVTWLISSASNFGTSVIFQGSNDTTNGIDGTWATGTFPSGHPIINANPSDNWRTVFKPVTFSTEYIAYRFKQYSGNAGSTNNSWAGVHIWGTKTEAHDLVFVDVDASPDVDFTSDIDFGDQASNTQTAERALAVRNTSASRTANNVDVIADNSLFQVASSSGGTYGDTVSLGSISPGSTSSTVYVRGTMPSTLGPYAVPLRVSCDSGFFD